MCRLNKKFVAFFITLMLGLTIAAVVQRHSWQSNADYYISHSRPYVSAREFTPVERNFMAAIRKVKIRQTEYQISRSSFGSDITASFRKSYESRNSTESLELQVDRLNAECTTEQLSDAACEAKFLNAIAVTEELDTVGGK